MHLSPLFGWPHEVGQKCATADTPIVRDAWWVHRMRFVRIMVISTCASHKCGDSGMKPVDCTNDATKTKWTNESMCMEKSTHSSNWICPMKICRIRLWYSTERQLILFNNSLKKYRPHWYILVDFFFHMRIAFYKQNLCLAWTCGSTPFSFRVPSSLLQLHYIAWARNSLSKHRRRRRRRRHAHQPRACDKMNDDKNTNSHAIAICTQKNTKTRCQRICFPWRLRADKHTV